MASLIVLPRSSHAFSNYRPSSNAHIDIINSAANGDAGEKVVRLNLPHAPAPLDDLESSQAVYNAIEFLMVGKPAPASYQRVSALVRHVSAGPSAGVKALYEAIDAEVSKRVTAIERDSRSAIMAREDGWLRRLVRSWEVYWGRVNLVAALFVYLDKVYATEGSGNLTICDLATEKFREGVWKNPLVQDKTRTEFLSWVIAERDGTASDTRHDAIDTVKLSQTLGTFGSLTAPYLDTAREHYDAAAAARVANVQNGTLTGTEYVQWALDREDEERARAREVLSPEVADSVVDIVRHETGELKAADVVPKALDEAMYRADTQALNRLYRFCYDAKAFNVFSKALHDHIECRIRAVISDPDNDPQMIDSTLKLKRFSDMAIAALFSQQPKTPSDEDTDMEGDSKPSVPERKWQLELEEAARSGFKAGLGSRQNAPAEWIAKYLDGAMRRGPGSGTEAEFNELLNEVIALVGYTKDKDVFRAFYASGLAKRLLLSKSASDDMERNMIVKLQNEMGDEFTSGDVMMKDLQLSETLIKSYQSAKAKNPESFKDKFDFTANVLTESAWPPYPLLKDGWDFKLTPELQSSIDSFTSWYATQHQNRKLSWRHQLSTVTLIARFESGQYEVGVSLFQAVVLQQFNEVDVLDFTQLKARTGIESSELIRTLQSLSMGRKGTRVLLKRPQGKEVEPTDKFAYNKGFKSEKIKFKINQIQQDLSAEESRKTNEQVAIDRVSVMEATIVRIMKSRKALTLQLLIDAVVTDVSKRFPPDVKEIKKRVESLIEREYLQRDEDDRNKLTYLA